MNCPSRYASAYKTPEPELSIMNSFATWMKSHSRYCMWTCPRVRMCRSTCVYRWSFSRWLTVVQMKKCTIMPTIKAMKWAMDNLAKTISTCATCSTFANVSAAMRKWQVSTCWIRPLITWLIRRLRLFSSRRANNWWIAPCWLTTFALWGRCNC